MGLVDHDSITFGALLDRQLAIARKDGRFREAAPEARWRATSRHVWTLRMGNLS